MRLAKINHKITAGSLRCRIIGRISRCQLLRKLEDAKFEPTLVMRGPRIEEALIALHESGSDHDRYVPTCNGSEDLETSWDNYHA